MKIRKKRALALPAGILVTIIIALVVFVALLRVDKAAIQVMQGVGEDQGCVWSAAIQSLTKIGGKTTYQLDCPADHLDLEYDDLKAPITKGKLEKLKKWWLGFHNLYTGENGKLDRDEKRRLSVNYNVNQIIANEMRSCWNKLGRGNLNLFDQEWSPVGYEEETFTGDEGFVLKSLKHAKVWDLEFKKTEKFCIICSTVTFDKGTAKAVNKVQDDFPEQLVSLNFWMEKHPANVFLPKPISYYEFLLDVNEDLGTLTEPVYEFRPSHETPLAVVFVRANVFFVHNLIDWIYSVKQRIINDMKTDKTDKGIDFIYLIPYNEIKNNCDRLEN